MCDRCGEHEARWFGKQNGLEDLCDFCFELDAFAWHEEQWQKAKEQNRVRKLGIEADKEMGHEN